MPTNRKVSQAVANGELESQSGDSAESSNAISARLAKKLYGVPNERGGFSWLDECPDFLQTTKKSEHALVVRYKEARSGPTNRTLNLFSINIQSPYLKQVVRQVFRYYPGIAVDEEEPLFEAPFHACFHQWATLHAALEKSKREHDFSRSEEIQTFIDVLYEELRDNMKDAQNLARNGSITFALLWMLFPPGCPVLSQWKGKQHLFLVNECKYLMAEAVPTLALELIVLDHNGERYGWHKTSQFVQAVGGTMRITALPVVPLQFHESSGALLDILYDRGANAANLIQESPAYKAYEGPVRLHSVYNMDEVEVFVEGRMLVDPLFHSHQASRYCPTVFTVPHRLECMLDRDSHTKIANAPGSGREGSDLLSVTDNLNQHPVLSVNRTQLRPRPLMNVSDRSPLRHHRWTEVLFGLRPEVFCRSAVRGYCLMSKSWAEFEVDNVNDIRWNRNAFDTLVIPPARKRLLEALVKQQQSHKTDTDLDDVVQGKGQGLIMLLAGPPGTGKTLTAESIADRLKLPLYAISASELGDTAKDIENHFGQVLRLAASWNAVLLLDEADAFLEKRSTVDTMQARERNKRVAAFLRILEYYKGILILTTNRTVDFDDAFYSRIHLTLPFKALDHESRKNIWRNFLRDAEIDPSELDQFASKELNGRQIKNVMKMARLLAKDEGVMVQASHIGDVLKVAYEDSELIQPKL